MTAMWHGTPSVPPDPAPQARRTLRRLALTALAALAVTDLLLWQRLGPSLAIESLALAADPRQVRCDGTADIAATVRTNGEAGTLTYRWLRSDGTTSGTLREKTTHGQRHARLHLLWTFQGQGRHEAHATLKVISPSRHSTTATFTYTCP
jgi:hypothetical protein